MWIYKSIQLYQMIARGNTKTIIQTFCYTDSIGLFLRPIHAQGEVVNSQEPQEKEGKRNFDQERRCNGVENLKRDRQSVHQECGEYVSVMP